jgi:gas vesicle protein
MHHYHDDVPHIVIEQRGGGFSTFVWGVLAGAAAGLLLAPRSGSETQEILRNTAERVRRSAEEGIDEVRHAVERTREAVQDQVTSVRDLFEDQADQARDAVDAGRQAARDARLNLERRIAEAKRTGRPEGGLSAAQPASAIEEAPPVGPEGDLVITEVEAEPLPPEERL